MNLTVMQESAAAARSSFYKDIERILGGREKQENMKKSVACMLYVLHNRVETGECDARKRS